MARLLVGPLWRLFGADQEPVTARAGVERWFHDLREGAEGLPEDALGDTEAVVATFDCDESGFEGLRLLGLYADQTELEWPESVPPVLELDRAWRDAVDKGFPASLFAHVLVPSLWLPADFTATVRFPAPDGGDADVGSAFLCGDQLRRLNGVTFDVGETAMRHFRDMPAPENGRFVDAARRGLAVATEAFEHARSHRLAVCLVPGEPDGL